MAENQGSEIVSFKEFGLNLDFFFLFVFNAVHKINAKEKNKVHVFIYLF